ncbi:YfiR family protein [Ramlibacter sp. MMS24-I3-19]|uniref:YfiR family protein n=1 Tax=Ramlibacter sp. MMS24-I3-19 TaxID=3416606 RepID=UPI003D01C4F4
MPATQRSRIPASRLRLAAACLLGWLAVLALCAQAQPVTESAVKAAFLYKFTAFVEWPPGTFQRGEDVLVIGVLGNDAVATDLEQVVAGRGVDGHAIDVRRLRDGDTLRGLHVLFIGEGRETRVRELVQATPGPVLVVTEQDAGLRLGSVLNFVNDGGRVRFAASLTAAEARGLRLSARLLAVAQSVEGRAR